MHYIGKWYYKNMLLHILTVFVLKTNVYTPKRYIHAKFLLVITHENIYKSKNKTRKCSSLLLRIPKNGSAVKCTVRTMQTCQIKFEPAHDKPYCKTCVTSRDSDQPVHPSGLARALVYPFLNSLGAVEDACDQRRLWSDCADTQADLSLRSSHKYKTGIRKYNRVDHDILASLKYTDQSVLLTHLSQFTT